LTRGPSSKPHKKPHKNARPIAPSKGDILGRRFIAIKREDQLNSNLDNLRNDFLEKYAVPYRDIDDLLVVSISALKYAGDRVRCETCRIYPKGSVRWYIPYTTLEDGDMLREQARAQKMVTTGREVRYSLKRRSDYPAGGLYVIWEEAERECFYVGMADGDPATRADQHFVRDNKRAFSLFDKYCQEHLIESASWNMYLIEPKWCDSIVRKSLFWDQEEYDAHMPRLENTYSNMITSTPRLFMKHAELAMIKNFSPRYNDAGSVSR
jgi:hypothetical protein